MTENKDPKIPVLSPESRVWVLVSCHVLGSGTLQKRERAERGRVEESFASLSPDGGMTEKENPFKVKDCTGQNFLRLNNPLLPSDDPSSVRSSSAKIIK